MRERDRERAQACFAHLHGGARGRPPVPQGDVGKIRRLARLPARPSATVLRTGRGVPSSAPRALLGTTSHREEGEGGEGRGTRKKRTGRRRRGKGGKEREGRTGEEEEEREGWHRREEVCALLRF